MTIERAAMDGRYRMVLTSGYEVFGLTLDLQGNMIE